MQGVCSMHLTLEEPTRGGCATVRYTLTRMGRLIASRSGFAETAAWAGTIPARALVRAPGCLFSNGVEVPDGAEF